MYSIRNSISSCFWYKPQTLYIVYQRTKRKDLSTYDALTKISDVYNIRYLYAMSKFSHCQLKIRRLLGFIVCKFHLSFSITFK